MTPVKGRPMQRDDTGAVELPTGVVVMKHEVEQTSEGVRIRATVAAESQRALLDEFAKCAAGACACPTPQYEKVQAMDVTTHEAGVTVELKVKPGESIDITDIERCMEHTARQIGC